MQTILPDAILPQPVAEGASSAHDGELRTLLDLSVPTPTPAPTASADPKVNSGTDRDESTGRQPHSLLNSATSLEGELNVIVAGLTRDVDDVSLRAMFAPYGQVVSATVMRHVGTGASRGFGFVLFETESAGEIAIHAMHGKRCGPNTLNVHRSLHDGTIVETNAVFVRNLPLDVTVQRVFSFFERVGLAQKIDIADDMGKDAGSAPNGKRFRVATVTFPDVETARACVKAYHNTPFPVQETEEPPLVIVKFAESAEYRRKRRSQQRPTPAKPQQQQQQQQQLNSPSRQASQPGSLQTSTTSVPSPVYSLAGGPMPVGSSAPHLTAQALPPAVQQPASHLQQQPQPQHQPPPQPILQQYHVSPPPGAAVLTTPTYQHQQHQLHQHPPAPQQLSHHQEVQFVSSPSQAPQAPQMVHQAPPGEHYSPAIYHSAQQQPQPVLQDRPQLALHSGMAGQQQVYQQPQPQQVYQQQQPQQVYQQQQQSAILPLPTHTTDAPPPPPVQIVHQQHHYHQHTPPGNYMSAPQPHMVQQQQQQQQQYQPIPNGTTSSPQQQVFFLAPQNSTPPQRQSLSPPTTTSPHLQPVHPMHNQQPAPAAPSSSGAPTPPLPAGSWMPTLDQQPAPTSVLMSSIPPG